MTRRTSSSLVLVLVPGPGPSPLSCSRCRRSFAETLMTLAYMAGEKRFSVTLVTPTLRFSDLFFNLFSSSWPVAIPHLFWVLYPNYLGVHGWFPSLSWSFCPLVERDLPSLRPSFGLLGYYPETLNTCFDSDWGVSKHSLLNYCWGCYAQFFHSLALFFKELKDVLESHISRKSLTLRPSQSLFFKSSINYFTSASCVEERVGIIGKGCTLKPNLQRLRLICTSWLRSRRGWVLISHDTPPWKS